MLHMLIVDDSPEDREVVRRLLTASARLLRVTEAATGAEALSILRHGAQEAIGKGALNAESLNRCVENAVARFGTMRELQLRENRLNLALAAANLGTWDFNPITGAIDCDRRCKDLFGLPATAAADYDSFLAAIHPDDREHARQAIQRAIAGIPERFTGLRFFRDGRELRAEDLPMQMAAAQGVDVWNAEVEIRLPSGLVRWSLSNVRPLFDRANRVRGCIAAVLDITERKESEWRWRQLAEAMPHQVWTCTPDGACDYLSPQRIGYTGIPLDAQLGFGWLQCVYPDDRNTLRAAWRQAMAAGTAFEGECRLRRSDGAWRWFHAQAVPVRDAGAGSSSGMVPTAISTISRPPRQRCARARRACAPCSSPRTMHLRCWTNRDSSSVTRPPCDCSAPPRKMRCWAGYRRPFPRPSTRRRQPVGPGQGASRHRLP